jgi:hypothetical protein
MAAGQIHAVITAEEVKNIIILKIKIKSNQRRFYLFKN